MENLGKYLQAQREAQRVSIEEMAFRTKIPIRFIQAIEAEQFDQISSQVSAKGFLRSYVQCLGLDDGPILEAFAQQVVPAIDSFSASEDQDEILSYLQVKTPSRLPFPRRILLLVGGVVVLLLILVGLLPEREIEVRTVPPPMLSEEPPLTVLPQEPIDATSKSGGPDLGGTQDLAPPVEVTPSGGGLPIEKSPVTPGGLPSEAAPATVPTIKEKVLPEPTLEAGVYMLSIEASESSWVLVEIDGKEVREVLLQAKDKVDWRGKEKFLLKLGNAGGVRVTLNGKDLGSFGPSGAVVEKEIIGAVAMEN